MAERIHFTDARVKALKAEAKRRDVYDDDQKKLCVTIRPEGSKVYYLVKKIGGRVTRYRIAAVADINVDKARTRAHVLNGQIADGKDPAEQRRAVKAEMSLGELWALFKKRHGPKKRSLLTDERRWTKHLAVWSSRKLGSITRTDVVRLLDTITASSGPGAANRTRALLHTLYAKAIEWGASVQNPVAGTARNRETSKERYLST
ncbi:MAG: integrase arm-type DNA-binding domain-containing protein, partial [Thermoanaerobaculales bacterium]